MHAHIHADGVDRHIHARRGYRLSSCSDVIQARHNDGRL